MNQPLSDPKAELRALRGLQRVTDEQVQTIRTDVTAIMNALGGLENQVRKLVEDYVGATSRDLVESIEANLANINEVRAAVIDLEEASDA